MNKNQLIGRLVIASNKIRNLGSLLKSQEDAIQHEYKDEAQAMNRECKRLVNVLLSLVSQLQTDIRRLN